MASQSELSAAEMCNRSIAYFKASYPDLVGNHPKPAVVLSFDDAPVTREYCDGLAIAYLVDDLFDRILAPHCPNGFVAAIPARDILAVCPRESAVGIRELKELIERIGPKVDHPLIRNLLVRDGKRWVPLTDTFL